MNAARKRFAELVSEVSALNYDDLLSINQLTGALLQEASYQFNGYPTFSQPEGEAA